MQPMTLREFVKDVYDIRPIILQLKSDPIAMIMDRDDLPCDDVKYIDGQLQKVVYIADEDYVSVTELLSYLPEEVDKMGDDSIEFKQAYLAYLDNVDITQVNIAGIMNAARDIRISSTKREDLLTKITEGN